jgi:hypothetical protein
MNDTWLRAKLYFGKERGQSDKPKNGARMVIRVAANRTSEVRESIDRQ